MLNKANSIAKSEKKIILQVNKESSEKQNIQWVVGVCKKMPHWCETIEENRQARLRICQGKSALNNYSLQPRYAEQTTNEWPWIRQPFAAEDHASCHFCLLRRNHRDTRHSGIFVVHHLNAADYQSNVHVHSCMTTVNPSSNGYYWKDHAPITKAQITSNWVLEGDNDFTVLKLPQSLKHSIPAHRGWAAWVSCSGDSFKSLYRSNIDPNVRFCSVFFICCPMQNKSNLDSFEAQRRSYPILPKYT